MQYAVCSSLAHRSASYIAYKYVCAIAVRKQYAGGRRVSSGQVEEGKWEESLDAFFYYALKTFSFDFLSWFIYAFFVVFYLFIQSLVSETKTACG